VVYNAPPVIESSTKRSGGPSGRIRLGKKSFRTRVGRYEEKEGIGAHLLAVYEAGAAKRAPHSRGVRHENGPRGGKTLRERRAGRRPARLLGKLPLPVRKKSVSQGLALAVDERKNLVPEIGEKEKGEERREKRGEKRVEGEKRREKKKVGGGKREKRKREERK